MIEEIAQFLLKVVVGFLDFIISLAIFRPIYWFGWILLKVISFGFFPKLGINQSDSESISIEYLTWLMGFIVIGFLIYFSFS